MAWTDEERNRAIAQIPQDAFQAPKPNAFGDAAAVAANPGIIRVPNAPATAAAPPASTPSGPLQRQANIAAAATQSTGPAQSLVGAGFAGAPKANTVNYDSATNSYSGGNVGGNVSINGSAPVVGAGLAARAFANPPAAAAASQAQALIDRAFAQPANAPAPQFTAPQVAHSGNDWETRNNLRNLEVSASSITNNGGNFDSRRGRINGPSLAQMAFMDASRADLAARAEQPRMEMATNQVNAGLQREGMEQAGNQQRSLVQAAMDQQRNQGDMSRAVMSEEGANRRSLVQAALGEQNNQTELEKARIAALGTVQAAQTKATAGNAPAGYRYAGNGSLEAIPGGPADKSQAPLNDVQSKALQFGSRMEESGKNLTDLANKGVTQPGLIKRMADGVGMGMAANWTQSAEQQKVEQSQRDFINAVLRRESGAAIADSEFDNARKQYFPQPGDTQEVIDQKLKNRAIATAGIKAEVPNADSRIGQVLNAGNAAVNAQGGSGDHMSELQRRAANDPALAARLKEMGY